MSNVKPSAAWALRARGVLRIHFLWASLRPNQRVLGGNDCVISKEQFLQDESSGRESKLI